MPDIRFSPATPVISAAPYAIGDIVGDLIPFNRLLGSQVEGYVTHVQLVDSGNNGPELRLHLFDLPLTPAADNAAIAFSAANILACGYFHTIDIPAASYVALSTGVKKAEVSKLVLPVINNLFGVLEARSVFTPATVSDLRVSIFVQAI